jgi:hypothetical protein
MNTNNGERDSQLYECKFFKKPAIFLLMATLLLACLLSAYSIIFLVFGCIGSDGYTPVWQTALLAPFAAWQITIGIAAIVFLILQAVRTYFKTVYPHKIFAATWQKVNASISIVSIISFIIGLFFFMGPSQNDKCKAQLGDLAIYNNGKCDCDYGSTIINKKCTSLDETCKSTGGPHAIADNLNNNCKCEAGYMLVDSVCTLGEEYCQKLHGIGSVMSYDQTTCGCGTGYVNDHKSQICQCADEYIRENATGECKPQPFCGYLGFYSKEAGKCVCQDGTLLIDGTCKVNPCAYGTTYDLKTGNCY